MHGSDTRGAAPCQKGTALSIWLAVRGTALGAVQHFSWLLLLLKGIASSRHAVLSQLKKDPEGKSQDPPLQSQARPSQRVGLALIGKTLLD